MTALVEVAGTTMSDRVFLTWAPVAASVRLASPAPAPVEVELSGTGTAGLVFDTARSDRGLAKLALTLPSDGSPVPFWVAGEFGKPGSGLDDTAIDVVHVASGAILGGRPVSVRIRKNAQTLPPGERDRFLAALGSLNARGHGPYQSLRDMHTRPSDAEMHGNTGFLPWHRAYVLDLERLLQDIDQMVTVPYWRFDQPAPALFTADFMGETGADASRLVRFRPGHPFEGWVTDAQLGIIRVPLFPVTDPAPVRSELDTMKLGGFADAFSGFHQMEGDPHGQAHVSFGGPISSPSTAVRDPLFFLLHANVDRLWAKWQWLFHRANHTDPLAYAAPRPDRDGHRLTDTMWPWNGVTGTPRPPTAPGGRFPTRDRLQPDGQPTVRSMLDYLGVVSPEPLGFAYDDVPFEMPPPGVA